MTTTVQDTQTAVTREEIKNALSGAGAFCGQCGFEPGDRGDCPDCERCWDAYADAVMPVVEVTNAITLTHAAGQLMRIADETETRVADHYGRASGIGPGSADMVREAARTVLALVPKLPAPAGPERIVICGSTRYTAEMAAIEQLLTWRGASVFAPTKCDLKSPNPLWDDPAERAAGATRLADLHAAMICDAHWVLVVGPYAGESTRGEIAHANALGKPVRFTDPGMAAEFGGEVWQPETAATA